MDAIFWIKLNPIINMETIGNSLKWRTEESISVFAHNRKISLYRTKSIFPRSNRRGIYEHFIFESIHSLITDIYDNSLIGLGLGNSWNRDSFWEIFEGILVSLYFLCHFLIIDYFIVLKCTLIVYLQDHIRHHGSHRRHIILCHGSQHISLVDDIFEDRTL